MSKFSADEVKRLEAVFALAYDGPTTGAARDAAIRAVLADLGERYILLPREGLENVYAVRFDDEAQVTLFGGDGYVAGQVDLDFLAGSEKDASEALARFLLAAFPKPEPAP